MRYIVGAGGGVVRQHEAAAAILDVDEFRKLVDEGAGVQPVEDRERIRQFRIRNDGQQPLAEALESDRGILRMRAS
jgi:hypothetical protein